MNDISPCLTFAGHQQGTAQAAIDFYVSLFPQSSIEHVDVYGPSEGEPDGTVRSAVFSLKGQTFLAMASAMLPPFTFTPSISLFVACDTEAEIVHLYSVLSDGGEVLMPLDNYGFSRRFGWANDRFGVSWQLNQAA